MSPPARAILADVASARGVPVAQILSHRRTRRIAEARQEAWSRIYALRAGGPSHTAVYSLPQIGGWFDRDHTTVLHGIRAHKKRMAEGRA